MDHEVNHQDIFNKITRVLHTERIEKSAITSMAIDESIEAGCDLIVKYKRRGAENSLGIHFNNSAEAAHAQNVIQRGDAGLGVEAIAKGQQAVSSAPHNRQFDVSL